MRLIATAVAALAAAPAAVHAANPSTAQPLLRTPGNAAYCYLAPGGLEPANPAVACWTPNDGFTVTVAHDEPRGREQQRKSYRPRNRGRTPSGYKMLRFGKTLRVRCDVDGAFVDNCLRGGQQVAFTCASRRSGLTCRNRAGRGFWLGRFRGYRIF